MLYLGLTKERRRFSPRGKAHLVNVVTGYETNALCGARIVGYVTNYQTHFPVKFAEHWLNDAGNPESLCWNCQHQYEKIKQELEAIERGG